MCGGAWRPAPYCKHTIWIEMYVLQLHLNAYAARWYTVVLGMPNYCSNTCRFELDDGHPVLYLYEVQIAPLAQMKGLGSRFMILLERFVSDANLLMLTRRHL